MDKSILRMVLRLTAVLAVSIGVFTSSYIFFSPKAGLLFPNSDFELGTLENWQVEGAAFLNQPTLGDNPAVRHLSLGKSLQGRYWVGSYENRSSGEMAAGSIQGDVPQGKLISVSFKMTRPWLSFMAGAGNGSPQTSINLLVDGKAVLTESPTAGPQGNESMHRVRWNTSGWLGKKARIEIRDEASTPEGHINADDFRFE